MFALRYLVEKACEQDCKVYIGYIYPQKPHDCVDRKALWQTLRLFCVDGKLFNNMKKVYVGGQASVRINGKLSNWFDIKGDVKEGA